MNIKTTVAVCAISILPTLSFAGENNYATITSVNPMYKNNYVTQYDKECYNVEVPIYRERVVQGSGADALIGGIIGAAVGNQFGNGNGKDVMTGLGAIFGANQASNRRVQEVTGYRIQEQCDNVAVRVNEPTIYSYTIRYEYNGSSYTQETTKRYVLGQKVRIQMSLN